MYILHELGGNPQYYFCRPVYMSLSAILSLYSILPIYATGNVAIATTGSASPAYLPAKDINHCVVVSDDSYLSKVRLVANSDMLNSINSATGPDSGPALIKLDLWIAGVFAATLLEVPFGLNTFDVSASPNILISAGVPFQYVFDMSGRTNGALGNLLLSTGFVPA